MKTAKRIKNVPPYLFAQIDKKKAEMQKQGKDIIDFGIGDPDLPTPKHIVDEMKRALDDPKAQRYPPYEGTKDFRQAVADWYQERFGVTLDANNEVMALIGSKEGIAHMILGMIDPGDVALIPDPAYPVYKTMTILAGGKPVLMPLTAKNHFLPDLKKINAKTARKAKIMFVNYPNNPTGAVATLEFYQEAVAFCKKYDILLCSDLAYSEISYDGFNPPSVLQVPGAKDVAVEFHSLSKTYNMTGWRLGMAVGNADGIRALSIIKTNVDSGAYKAIQMAGIAALRGSQSAINESNAIMQERRDILVSGLNRLGFKVEKPKSTFYIWVAVPKGYTSASFAEKLLLQASVLVVPGSGYGKYGEGYVRLAITIPKERIEEALVRLAKIKL